MKQTIEEAAYEYSERAYKHFDEDVKDFCINNGYEDFVKGATSPEAQEHWQQNMYSEEDMRNYAFFFCKMQQRDKSNNLIGRDLLTMYLEHKKELNGSS